MANDKDQKSKGNFINKPQEGRKRRHGGAYPTGASYITKRGGDKLPSLEGYHGEAAPLCHRGLEVGAADADSGEDPHRGLQRPQLEAEDEVVTDVEAVAEGEGPPAPGENGIAVRSKEDVHRPEEIWPALLHQRASLEEAPGA
jgi:hypothetical protein